jgi:hypothetical protein
MDGYHVTHDPAMASVVEPTTQRKLNVLDVPASTTATISSKRSSTSSKRSSRRVSVDVAKGRALSPSQIRSPKPYKPGQTKHIVNYDLAQLEQQFAHTHIAEESHSDSDDSYDGSDVSSDVPSLTSRSSQSSTPSSLSSGSSNGEYCVCERYGITRSGNRIKLDCGGKRCGYSGNGSDCSSESEEETYHARATRRHGVVIRGR